MFLVVSVKNPFAAAAVDRARAKPVQLARREWAAALAEVRTNLGEHQVHESGIVIQARHGNVEWRRHFHRRDQLCGAREEIGPSILARTSSMIS
jgi:hypothetical protein